MVRPHNQTRPSCSSAHHHPVTKSPWWALWLEMHLTVDGRCIQAASPLGNYKTELYDPAMEKYQPSPQWINLFVFVKDPENKVRQALTPCSAAPFTRPLPSTPALRGLQRQCLVLPSPPFLRGGPISSQAGGLKEGHAVCKLHSTVLYWQCWDLRFSNLDRCLFSHVLLPGLASEGQNLGYPRPSGQLHLHLPGTRRARGLPSSQVQPVRPLL